MSNPEKWALFNLLFHTIFNNFIPNLDLCFNFQIMWLVDIFRAKIVDTAEQSLTIEVTVVKKTLSCCMNDFGCLLLWNLKNAFGLQGIIWVCRYKYIINSVENSQESVFLIQNFEHPFVLWYVKFKISSVHLIQ